MTEPSADERDAPDEPQGEPDDVDWFPARKQPVVVEAAGPFRDPRVVETIEGDYEIDGEYLDEHGGYYLIRGVEGEIYPCAADVFGETYERVLADDVNQSQEGSDHD